jgi:hypothetical protein
MALLVGSQSWRRPVQPSRETCGGKCMGAAGFVCFLEIESSHFYFILFYFILFLPKILPARRITRKETKKLSSLDLITILPANSFGSSSHLSAQPS